MITNRIAGTAALATFGLAALGGIALAAPSNADAGSGRSSGSSSSTSGGSSSYFPATGPRGGTITTVGGSGTLTAEYGPNGEFKRVTYHPGNPAAGAVVNPADDWRTAGASCRQENC